MLKTTRTHHCKQCGDCLLKMDHHCVIIANCVGLGNHRYYVILIGVALFSEMILTAEIVFYSYKYYLPLVRSLESPYCYMRGAFYGWLNMMQWSTFSGILALFFMHLSYALLNSTTIERKNKALVIANPFSMGIFYNLKTFFKDFWTFLLPINYNIKYEGFFFHQKCIDPDSTNLNLFNEKSPNLFEAHTIEDAVTMLEKGEVN